jgi:hypothetical protein
MAKAKRVYHVKRSSETGRFVLVNREYVHRQAKEAFDTFFAPVSGALKAAKSAGKPEVANDRKR